MFLFDTNVFLELLLDQDKADECEQAIESVDLDREGWISAFSLHAIEAIVGGRAKKSKVLEIFLVALQEHPHFYLYSTTIEEDLEILRLSTKLKLDFDDALQYYIAKKKGLALVTLDRDFKKTKAVVILAPVNLVDK